MTNEKNSPEMKLGVIDDIHIWKMPVFSDLRGRLFEAYVAEPTGSFPTPFTTFEHFFTESNKNVFRGMHFQGEPHSVTKVISLVQGATIDFLLDMREDSRTFATFQILEMNEKNPVSILIPPGIAHGYLVLQDKTLISYRMNGPFCENCDGGISGDFVTPYLPIPFSETIRSARDLALPVFADYIYSSKC